MDGPQDICDAEWIDADGLGASKTFFSAEGEGTSLAPPSSSLAQKGAVVDVEQKKSSRARPRSTGYAKKDREEKKVKAHVDPSPADALKKMKGDAKYKEHIRFFAVFDDKLHCNLCGTSFGTRSNVRRDHIGSDKHKRLLGQGEKKQQTIEGSYENGGEGERRSSPSCYGCFDGVKHQDWSSESQAD